MPRTGLKNIFILFSIFVTLTIITLGAAISYAFFTLEDEMNQKLEAKRILLPTEYYAAPFRFRAPSLLKLEKAEKALQAQSYRSRDWQLRLLPGDYLKASAAECRALYKLPEELSFENCIAFVKKDVDPNQIEKEMNILLFSAESALSQAFKAFPLTPAAEISLEPALVAQYVGIEPIMQEEATLGSIPPACSNAVMAVEDARFLEHGGVSYTGIFRALVKNITSGRAAQGGSTITQQLVKNYFLTSEKTLKRKLQEFMMSYMLEAKFSKDQILETYLNIIYMGQNGPFQVRGFGAASRYYFNKEISNLNMSECALLAAIVNNPGMNNPFKRPEKAIQRRDFVLDKMAEHKFVSAEMVTQAKKEPLPNLVPRLATETAPYYLDAVRKQLQTQGIDLAGAKIYTALDLNAQQAAQEALRNHLDRLEKQNKFIVKQKEKGLSLEGMVLSADSATGLINVAVGGRSYRLTQFNRAVDGHRQVGSIMKPFVFLTALGIEKDGKPFTPTTLLKDEKFTIKYENQKWSPDNYGGDYFGNVPMYFALKNSLNAATASLGLDIGLDNIINTARSFGITSPMKALPSLTLGAFELYPKEVLQSYMAFSRMGQKTEMSFVKKVMNIKNEEVYNFEPHFEQVFDPVNVAILVGMMKQTILSGSARSITLNGYFNPAAGKTGTTSDNRDAWFGGFTPYRTTVVWVGYDNNIPHKLTGSSGAVPVWTDFMRKATAEDPPDDFVWPEGTEKETLDQDKLKELNVPPTDPPTVDLIFRD